MITRIYADNFRCLSNFTFEPKQANLLVGENGAGKTSLLDVVSGLRALAQRTDALTIAFPPNSRTRWDARTTQRFELDLTTADGAAFHWAVVLDAEGSNGKTVVQSETIKKDGAVIAERESAGKRARVRGTEIPLPYQLDGSLLSLRMEDADLVTLHGVVSDIMMLKLDLTRMEATTTKPSASLRFDGANFLSNYRHSRDTDFERTRRLHEALSDCLGGFRSLELEDISEEAKFLVVKLFAERGKPDYRLSFFELSDGQRALVVLYHLLVAFDLRHRPLFVDEPDNFVSLRELQPWLQHLTRAMEQERAQPFVVSHNPEVIDYLGADSAWLFERAEGGPVRVRTLPVDRDSGLRASEQLARGWVDGA